MSKQTEEKRVERQWSILHLMGEKAGVLKKDLAQILGVSRKTIKRDIETLIEVGFPIVEEKEQQKTIYRFMKGYTFPKIDLSITENISLLLIKDLGYFLKDTPYYKDLQNAFTKLHDYVSSANAEYVHSLRSIVHFRLPMVKGNKILAQWVEQTQRACDEERCLEIDYRSTRSGVYKKRIIHPYGINQEDGTIHLIAFCPKSKQQKTYTLDHKMRSLKILEEKFEHNNLELQGSSRKDSENCMEAVLRISPPASRHVQERKWPGLRKIVKFENCIEMHFDNCKREDLKRWTLELGEFAEIVEPKDLREEIYTEINNMLKKYQKKGG